MDICAIICEFNPFHNGHAYLIERARALSGCDAVLCLMSGSFTQRGDMCVLDKYVRARHAILGGADVVAELPAPYAVAPAEIFADGAVSILSAIKEVKYLAFGCEEVTDFDAVARRLLCETDEFRQRFYALLDSGTGYAAAYSQAAGTDKKLLSSPNNILAAEYAKSNLRRGSTFKLLPVKRCGNAYACTELDGEYCSAKAIRLNRNDDAIKRFVPEYVLNDLRSFPDNTEKFSKLSADALFFKNAADIAMQFGCSEGLENRLKKMCVCGNADEIERTCTGRRYSAARIRRIMTGNLLGLNAAATKKALDEQPLTRVLAVRRGMSDQLLPPLSSLYKNASGYLCNSTDTSYKVWRYINYPYGEHNENQKINFI